MIGLTCSACGQRLQIPDEFAGKKGKCPHCRKVQFVPAVAGQTTAPPAGPTDDLWVKAKSAARKAADHTTLLAPPQRPDELGRLGKYRVLKVLGSGGMGVVFLAEDVEHQRQVALKTMLPEAAANERSRKRFVREARATQAFEHEHIVTIYQVGEDRGAPFLAMQFLQGESLHERLGREGTLPIPEVLRIGREVAEGLAAAHARGLIHRDIKPANIWLEGQAGQVKILDFGLVRMAGDDQRLTQTGMIVGTPEYMAPEQARAETVDARCDLFSLGCVLYHLCTGRQPFQGHDTMSTLMALALENPMPVCLVNLEAPAGLSDLIEKLMAKKPEDRPAEARVVVEAIKAIEAGETPNLPAASDATARPADVSGTTRQKGGRLRAVLRFFRLFR
jgi:serine/threonine protein kinase